MTISFSKRNKAKEGFSIKISLGGRFSKRHLIPSFVLFYEFFLFPIDKTKFLYQSF